MRLKSRRVSNETCVLLVCILPVNITLTIYEISYQYLTFISCPLIQIKIFICILEMVKDYQLSLSIDSF